MMSPSTVKGSPLTPPATQAARTLVVIATYNEIENLPALTESILEFAEDVEILVIDDNSPDGTGRWCDEQSQHDRRLRCQHRAGKLGLGTATIAGLSTAIQEGYDFVLTMDADFSHHPRHIPELRSRILESGTDVAIGSRYVRGGSVVGWPWYRRLMSRVINAFSRQVLGLDVADCSGAFRCYRVDALKRLDLSQVTSTGYAYLEEILWLLSRDGATFSEVPITFADRELGETKINWREAVQAVTTILRLGGQRVWRGRVES